MKEKTALEKLRKTRAIKVRQHLISHLNNTFNSTSESARMKFLLASLACLLQVVCSQRLDLENVREWKQLDFNFPTPAARNEAVQKKLFIPANVFLIDVDVDYQGRKCNYFLSISFY